MVAGPPTTMSKMPRLLDIFEIAELVLTLLAGSRSFGSVLRVGLASRSLFDQAMDYLWGSGCLLPFQVLQPLVASGAIGWNSPFEDFPRLIPRRPLKQHDWTRFHMYARRVRSLWWDTSEVDARILPVLARSGSGSAANKPLFPRLKQLVFHPDRDPPDDALVAYTLLLPRSLDAFQLLYRRAPVDSRERAVSIVEFWVGCLSIQCPHLKRLSISFDMVPGGYDNEPKPAELSSRTQLALARLLKSLTDLQEASISIKGLSLDVIPHLAALPSLQHLTFGHRPAAELAQLEVSPCQERALPSSFPQLRTIHFTATNDRPTDIGHVIQLSRNAPLQEIYLEWAMEGPTSLQGVLTAYAETDHDPANAATLQSLQLIHKPPLPTRRHPGDCVTMNHLYSLFAPRYRNLRHLCIQYPFFDLTDDDVTAIARWLPNLRTLSLGVQCRLAAEELPVPRVTIRGLLALQKGCTHLSRLSLSADLTDLTSLKDLEPGSRLSTFSCWDVLESRIGDPKAAAIALASLFPGLVRLRWRTKDLFRSVAQEAIESYLTDTISLRKSAKDTIPFDSPVWDSYW